MVAYDWGMRRLVFICAFLAGCPPTPQDPPSGPRFDEAACAEFVVPHRMGLRWRLLNHRVSTWSLRLNQGDCRAQTLEVTSIGGDFSTGETGADEPSVAYGFRTVMARPEELGVTRITVDAIVGPDDRDTGVVEVDRQASNLRNYPHVAVILEGLEFVTDVPQDEGYPDDYDPAHGYTMRGFGAGASVLSSDDETVSIEWTLHFEPGRSADRPAVNEALQHARVGAKLDLLIIGLADAAPATGSVSYSQSHPPPTPLVDQEVPHASDELRRLALSAPAGSDGFWGFSNFDFVLPFDGSCGEHSDCVFYRAFANACRDDGTCGEGGAEPGDYLREIAIAMELSERTDDGATFLVDGFISNASRFLANYALTYAFEADVVWVPFGEAQTAVIEEEFETGTTVFDLTRSNHQRSTIGTAARAVKNAIRNAPTTQRSGPERGFSRAVSGILTRSGARGSFLPSKYSVTRRTLRRFALKTTSATSPSPGAYPSTRSAVTVAPIPNSTRSGTRRRSASNMM